MTGPVCRDGAADLKVAFETHRERQLRIGLVIVESVVVASADSLWLIAGVFALLLGVLAFGINYNIRKSREAANESNRRLQQEVQRLRAKESSDPHPLSPVRPDFRREALAEALRRRPDLADAQDQESTRQLQELVTEVERELSLRHEVETLKAERAAADEAERRRAEMVEREAQRAAESERRAEAARQQAELRARADQERAVQVEKRRQERLAAMSAPRRWVEVHSTIAKGAGIAIVVAAVVVAWVAAGAYFNQQREQAAADEAASINAARVAASESAAAQKQAEEEEAQRQAELRTSCDPTQAEGTIPTEVWVAWLTCSDEAIIRVAETVLVTRTLDELDAEQLAMIATNSGNEELASLVSLQSSSTREVHQILIDRWSIDVVPASYEVMYAQECAGDTKPGQYVGRTAWASDTGAVIEFRVVGCEVWSDLDLNINGATRWQQQGDRVSVGMHTYRLEGDVLRLISEAGPFGLPKVLSRTR